MRLIDADKLKEYVKSVEDYESAYTINGIIDSAPTVEERPIHCKDCKHAVLSKDGKTLICCLTMMVGTVRPNFYCGNGELKREE